ncbi:MAG: GAF domain-containing protein [Gemmatimonadaceae bacterium]
MPPRTLASLAQALGAASGMDAALVALGEALADVDRTSRIALLRYDMRHQIFRERLAPVDANVHVTRVDTTFDHLPASVRTVISGAGEFAELGDDSDQYARLFGIAGPQEEGLLGLRGLHIDGQLAGVLALYEPKRLFGTRVSERFDPYAALFDLAFNRFAEHEARDEAVKTLEHVTQRVHGEYVRRLAGLEQQLREARAPKPGGGGGIDPAALLALETESAKAKEEARRSQRRTAAIEEQVTAAIGQLERAHIELHRRSEALRQKTRTLYLIDRLLTLDANCVDPKQLADSLLALVGDDMQAQRCSLMLRVPDTPSQLYIAAAKGISPDITDGTRVTIGEGVSGKVAATRQPLLVTDVGQQGGQHPLLRDEYLSTGSFISFPLVYHGQLVGVVNLTNRAQRGVYVEEDVERVRLLGLVISLVASNAQLSERLLEAISAR